METRDDCDALVVESRSVLCPPSRSNSLTLCGIDVIESELDGLIDLAGADILGDLPGPEPDSG